LAGEENTEKSGTADFLLLTPELRACFHGSLLIKRKGAVPVFSVFSPPASRAPRMFGFKPAAS